MVFLILSHKGIESLSAILREQKPHVWLSAGVLADAELAKLRQQLPSVSDFSYSIALGDAGALEDALQTIKEHHPNDIVFVES